MRPTRYRHVALAIAAAVCMPLCGCGREPLTVLRPPLPALREVPARAVVEPARLVQHRFALDAASEAYRPVPDAPPVAWLTEQRFSAICRQYLAAAGLFRGVEAAAPIGPGGTEPYLLCRPRVTVGERVRPSISGTMLTVGTGLIYNFLGGSAEYRHVDVDLALEVAAPSGRPLATYHCTGRSPERLATDAPDQLGPMISHALTRALEDASSRISADNDLLMRGLSADMAAKGALPIAGGRMRIVVARPKGVILRQSTAMLTGQVLGVDRPIELAWSLNGTPGGTVSLTDSAAASAKDFSVAVPLPEGLAQLALSVRDARPGRAAELARTEIAYLRVGGQGPAPEVRKRWAVVIGVSRYAHGGEAFPQLQYAARDAEAFHKFLRSKQSGGFAPERTLLLLNERATTGEVRHALFEFLARADRDDLVVVFFSGHGMPQPGTDNFFMLCHDTHPDRLASTAFPMWDIDTALRRFVRARRVVVFADACHAGAMAAPDGTRSAAQNPVHQYLRQLALARPGRLIFTASEARELSHEGRQWGGGHGVFTHFLLRGLGGEADADRDGVVSAGEVLEYVRRNVARETDGKQHPDPSGQFDRALPLAVVPGEKP